MTFDEYIRLHFTTLIGFEDKLYRIEERYQESIRSTIKELKDFLVVNYDPILGRSSLSEQQTQISKAFEQSVGMKILNRLKGFFWYNERNSGTRFDNP